MIRVRRPDSIPESLATRGARARDVLCEQYDAGARSFRFSNIYAAADVKETLKRAQFLKCGFCERVVGEDGHIEHFRPKAGVRQDRGGALSETGYYWLAYEWTNLLLACADCNVRHKENLFPLAPGSPRATSHRDSIRSEQPMFIDPAAEDPEEFIEWAAECPRAVDGHARALATLSALRLADRDGLAESRLQHIELVARVIEAVRVYRDAEPTSEVRSKLDKAEAALRRVASRPAKFSAMVRALLRREAMAQYFE